MRIVLPPHRLFAILLCALSCARGSHHHLSIDTHKEMDSYNFRFVSYSTNIDDPDTDRRSFYKIFVDKVEEGRTDIGLESQKKLFKTKLLENRHLLRVEKWILDEKAGKYLKLNNIDQPKPDFIYFDIPENGFVKVEMMVDKSGKADYQISSDQN